MTIGNSVTSIGNEAFSHCSALTGELTIPNSVTSIGSQAFASCSGFEKIIVESGNPNYDSRENCNAIIETNSNELIVGCKNTIIPGSVTSIGYSAFSNCSGLTEMTIPDSVTSISALAFYNCSGLTEVTIPNSVTSIGYSAFYGCRGLTEVTIGNSVTSIGDNAFYNCIGLTTLYSLNTTPPSVASTSTFSTNHYTNVDVFVPAEALEAYQTADVWKEFQKLQAIPDDGGTTAIEQVQVNGNTGAVTVYTLDGKKQTMKQTDLQSLPSGIYIVNGRKVVIK